MVSIGEHKEYVLEDWHEELLEKLARCVGIGLSNIGDQLEAHVESSIFDLTVVMLTRPHARINDELELPVVEFEKS